MNENLLAPFSPSFLDLFEDQVQAAISAALLSVLVLSAISPTVEATISTTGRNPIVVIVAAVP